LLAVKDGQESMPEQWDSGNEKRNGLISANLGRFCVVPYPVSGLRDKRDYHADKTAWNRRRML
jgi:hypothetical protein